MCSDDSAKLFETEVVSCLRLSEEYFRISIKAPRGVSSAPGQFFNFRTGGHPEPLWRRPFSVFDQRDDIIEFYIRIVGRGTRWLSERQEGDVLNVLGPLGKGFQLPQSNARCLLVAGGVGVAPLHFLSQSQII